MASAAARTRKEWLFKHIGVCGMAGVIVGLTSGLLLTIVDALDEPLALSVPEALQIWAMLAIAGWLMLLTIFTVVVRWTLRSVVAPALVNSILVTGLTVLTTALTGLYLIAWLLGVVLGVLVGTTLCGLYKQARKGR